VRKMKISFFLLSLSFLVNSCEVYHEKLVGDYYLDVHESRTDMTIVYVSEEGYRVGLMRPTVFAVGYNKQFIIIKQHPNHIRNGINRSITNYYIVPVENPVSRALDENVVGPLTKVEFEHARQEMAIPENLDFTIVFEDLE